MSTLEILDASGDITLQWDPDVPEEVAKAKAEFLKLQDCGYAFFSREVKIAKPVKRLGKTGVLDVQVPEKTKDFKPRGKTVAVRPLRGG